MSQRKNAAAMLAASRKVKTVTRTARFRMPPTGYLKCRLLRTVLPTYAQPRGPGDAGILASVVGSVVHVGELQAGLQLQSVSVEEVVRTEIDFGVLVAATSHDAIFIG